MSGPAAGPRRIPPSAALERQWCQVVRCHYAPGACYDLHRHGFAEVFWLERGRALHLLADGSQELEAGDLVFVRPDDAHAFQAPRRAGFVMVNVVLRRELPEELGRRHAEAVPGWPWSPGGVPRRLRLDPAQRARLALWVEELAADGSRLAAECFLLDLARRLCAPAPHRPGPDLPPWLAGAIRAFTAGGRMAEGPAALARLAGRSPAHLNRTVRRHFGTTATALANELRLQHAASGLRLGQEPILALSLACGFASLSHFYRAFRARFGTTPRRWRLEQRAIAGIKV